MDTHPLKLIDNCHVEDFSGLNQHWGVCRGKWQQGQPDLFAETQDLTGRKQLYAHRRCRARESRYRPDQQADRSQSEG